MEVLQNICGFKTVPKAGAYKSGFEVYRGGYVQHQLEDGVPHAEAVSMADERIHLIEYDEFAVTAWLYTMSLIGDSNGFGKTTMRVIERGPAGDCKLGLIPRHAEHEHGIRDYLIAALQRKYLGASIFPKFATEFIRRLSAQA